MIRILHQTEAMIEASLAETITHHDYHDTMLPAIKRQLDQTSSLNFCAVFEPDFHGYDMHALVDDALIGLRYWENWNKIALVHAPEWLDRSVHLFALFLPGKVRSFNDVLVAREWLKSE